MFLVYERWLVLKVWYMAGRLVARPAGQPAGPMLSPLHRLTLLCMRVKNCSFVMGFEFLAIYF